MCKDGRLHFRKGLGGEQVHNDYDDNALKDWIKFYQMLLSITKLYYSPSIINYLTIIMIIIVLYRGVEIVKFSTCPWTRKWP